LKHLNFVALYVDREASIEPNRLTSVVGAPSMGCTYG